MTDVEKLGSLQRRLYLAMTVSWALWFGPIVLAFSPWFTPAGSHVLHIVSSLFVLPMALGIIWLLLVQRRIKAQPQVFAALNDEMTIRNRWRASRFAMGAVMGCLMVGVGLVSFVHISAVMALSCLMWIAVVSKLGAYLWFDRGE